MADWLGFRLERISQLARITICDQCREAKFRLERISQLARMADSSFEGLR